ncbi:MAG TPA: glycosyltransferase family 4 protein, partial [Flavisolibacter sp.]|nr:glycosyltransferase family 4 protein [Flavisolibacter sp.]
MKILIVLDTLLTGGAELFALRLCRKLNEMGVKATILSMNAHLENKKMTSEFPEVPVKKIKIPFPKLLERIDHYLFRLKIDFELKSALQLIQLKRIAREYEIIHTNFIKNDYLFSRLKKKVAFKHIVTVHGDYSDYYYRKPGQLPEWLRLNNKLEVIKKQVDYFVVVSDEQREFLKQVLKVDKPIVKIYNGFEASEKLTVPAKSGIFKIGMISRGHPLKGWQTLIDAFLQLPEDCELFLAGESDFLSELEEKYTNNRIHFTGFCNNPVEFLNNLSVFVLPTIFPFESLPTVIIEALYCNVPIIASNIGEIEMMITDPSSGKKAGLLLELKNGIIETSQLVDQLMYLYNNPSVMMEF